MFLRDNYSDRTDTASKNTNNNILLKLHDKWKREN